MVYKCYFLIVFSKLNDEYVYIAIIILFRNKSIRRIKRKEKMKRMRKLRRNFKMKMVPNSIS